MCRAKERLLVAWHPAVKAKTTRTATRPEKKDKKDCQDTENNAQPQGQVLLIRVVSDITNMNLKSCVVQALLGTLTKVARLNGCETRLELFEFLPRVMLRDGVWGQKKQTVK